MAWTNRLPSLASARPESNVANIGDVRQQAAERLDFRMSEVFKKYAQDFGGCSDVIDLQTGKVVENNGHLAEMQDERDLGKQNSLRQGGTSCNVFDPNDTQDELSSPLTGSHQSPKRGQVDPQEQTAQPANTANSIQSAQWSMITPEALTQLGQTIALQIAEALKINMAATPNAPSNAATTVPDQSSTGAPSTNVPNFPLSYLQSPFIKRRLQLDRQPSPLVWGRSLWADGDDCSELDFEPDVVATTEKNDPFLNRSNDNQGSYSVSSSARLSKRRRTVDLRGASVDEDIQPRLSTPDNARLRGRYALFTDEDDDLLFRLRYEQGKMFKDIAEYFPGRDTQCITNRYNHYLKPGAPRKKVPRIERRTGMNEEQRRLLYDLKHDRGLSWDEIAEHFPWDTTGHLMNAYDQILLKSAELAQQREALTPPANEDESLQPIHRASEIPDSQEISDPPSRMITPPDSGRIEDATGSHYHSKTTESNASPLDVGVQRRSKRTSNRKHKSLALDQLVNWGDDDMTGVLEDDQHLSANVAKKRQSTFCDEVSVEFDSIQKSGAESHTTQLRARCSTQESEQSSLQEYGDSSALLRRFQKPIMGIDSSKVDEGSHPTNEISPSVPAGFGNTLKLPSDPMISAASMIVAKAPIIIGTAAPPERFKQRFMKWEDPDCVFIHYRPITGFQRPARSLISDPDPLHIGDPFVYEDPSVDYNVLSSSLKKNVNSTREMAKTLSSPGGVVQQRQHSNDLHANYGPDASAKSLLHTRISAKESNGSKKAFRMSQPASRSTDAPITLPAEQPDVTTALSDARRLPVAAHTFNEDGEDTSTSRIEHYYDQPTLSASPLTKGRLSYANSSTRSAAHTAPIATMYSVRQNYECSSNTSKLDSMAADEKDASAERHRSSAVFPIQDKTRSEFEAVGQQPGRGLVFPDDYSEDELA